MYFSELYWSLLWNFPIKKCTYYDFITWYLIMTLNFQIRTTNPRSSLSINNHLWQLFRSFIIISSICLFVFGLEILFHFLFHFRSSKSYSLALFTLWTFSPNLIFISNKSTKLSDSVPIWLPDEHWQAHVVWFDFVEDDDAEADRRVDESKNNVL